MADIEKMKTNLAKNEEKLAKKKALFAKYESQKAKLSVQWKKLTNQTFEESMEYLNSKNDSDLSLWGKLNKYYNEEVAFLHDKISTFYDYSRYSWNPLVRTADGIAELEKTIQTYKDKIAEEEKKNADRKASIESHSISVNGKDVNVIIEFLNNWELKITDHLMKVFDFYVNESSKWFDANIKDTIEYKIDHSSFTLREELENLWKDSEYTKFYPTYDAYSKAPYKNECYKAIHTVLNDLRETYESMFHTKTIERYAKTLYHPKKEVYEANMRKAIENEKNRKYDQLINDVEHICGKIIDMTHIKVGHLGDLEGYVIGTNGEAELWSTGCGGFNENVIVNVKHGQSFHFRFYVKKRM